jgi:hypothetical protein
VQFSHQSNKLLITGSSGTGKSTYFIKYIITSDYDYKFIYDHEGEFAAKTHLQSYSSAEEMTNAIRKGVRIIIYDPATNFPGDSEFGLEFFSSFVFQFSELVGGTKLFAVDELQKITSPNYIPWGVRQILQTGRRRGIDFVCCCQQVNELNNKIRGQLTKCVVFQTVEKLSIHWFKPWFSEKFNEDSLMRLNRGEYQTITLQGVGAGGIQKSFVKLPTQNISKKSVDMND